MTDIVERTTCTYRKAAPSLWTRIMRWMSLAQQRRTLKDLDAHLLRDVGLTREQALREAQRQPWDVPPHWHN